jgi:hypothetical protein
VWEFAKNWSVRRNSRYETKSGGASGKVQEQSREHLFYNELIYELKIFGTAGYLSRYMAQIALIFSSGLAMKSVPRLHGVYGKRISANREI